MGVAAAATSQQPIRIEAHAWCIRTTAAGKTAAAVEIIATLISKMFTLYDCERNFDISMLVTFSFVGLVNIKTSFYLCTVEHMDIQVNLFIENVLVLFWLIVEIFAKAYRASRIWNDN